MFIQAEKWWQKVASSPSQKNPERTGRNDSPAHDPPSSQGSDVPMTGVQRGRGDNIPLLTPFSRRRPAQCDQVPGHVGTFTNLDSMTSASQANNVGTSRRSPTSTITRDSSTSTMSSRSSSSASSVSRTSGSPGQRRADQNTAHASRTVHAAKDRLQGVVAKTATTTQNEAAIKPTTIIVDRTKGQPSAISHAIKPSTTANLAPKRV